MHNGEITKSIIIYFPYELEYKPLTVLAFRDKEQPINQWKL